MLIQLKFTCSVALLVPFLVCYKVAGLRGIINPPFFLNYLALFPFERPKRASCELDLQSWQFMSLLDNLEGKG